MKQSPMPPTHPCPSHPIPQRSTSSSCFSLSISYPKGLPEWEPEAGKAWETLYKSEVSSPTPTPTPNFLISFVFTSVTRGKPFLTQTEVTSLMLQMFYPKGGFTAESYSNQRFHWAVLNSPMRRETSIEGVSQRERVNLLGSLWEPSVWSSMASF